MTNSQEQGLHQPLIEHLSELRFRLIRSLWGILVGFIICYNLSGVIFDWMRAPIAPYLPGGGLVFTSPLDKFMSHIKIAFFGGMILACPWWVFQAWKFVSPGLYRRERNIGVVFIVSGTVLFILGCAFAYFVVFPMAFEFLMNYGSDVDKPMITIDQYMGFFTVTTLMFGLSFEMPLIIVTLALLGIVDHTFLKEKRRYAIVGIAGIAAVITPPDLMSMVLMLVPMVALYEMSVLVVGFLEKSKTKS